MGNHFDSHRGLGSGEFILRPWGISGCPVFHFRHDWRKESIQVYDHILTLGDEVTLVWPEKWGVGKVLFFLARYLPYLDLAVIFAGKCIQWTGSTNCWSLTRRESELSAKQPSEEWCRSIFRTAGCKSSKCLIPGSCWLTTCTTCRRVEPRWHLDYWMWALGHIPSVQRVTEELQ